MYAHVRLGVQSSDTEYLAEIRRVQNEIKLTAFGDTQFETMEYDEASFLETHHGVLDCFTSSRLLDTEEMFGTEDYVTMTNTLWARQMLGRCNFER